MSMETAKSSLPQASIFLKNRFHHTTRIFSLVSSQLKTMMDEPGHLAVPPPLVEGGERFSMEDDSSDFCGHMPHCN